MNEDLRDECAFKSSRIYGQGWTMARKLLNCIKGVVNVKQALERNPYHTAEERARWKKGFMDGLGSPTKPFTKRGQNPWRASAARRIRAGE